MKIVRVSVKHPVKYSADQNVRKEKEYINLLLGDFPPN